MLGEENPDTLGSMTNLSVVYERQGKYTQAETGFAKIVEVRRRVLGEEHPDTLGTMVSLGRVRFRASRRSLDGLRAVLNNASS